MHLKKLELSGFKSFMDKTCFTFDSGITAIVGPNGCGKSNVVDAVRWAMGEQSAKAMRGQSMEDVIFNGSDAHHPLGMAEVTLTFENTNGHTPPHLAGLTEIEISRRLFRSGESEYAINRVPCRRKDIWELFMDTGLGNRSYAIVEQDRVSRIINAKPEERRLVIEEVAGISKYRSRRDSAQRKMDATRQNLLRVDDIRGEIGNQIRSLERQAKKAERFKTIRLSILDLERRNQLRSWHDLSKRREGLEDQQGKIRTRQDQVLTRLQIHESSLEQERLEILQKERELSDAQECLFKKESEIQTLEGKIRGLEQEIKGLETMDGLLADESEELGKRIHASKLEYGRFEKERVALEGKKASAEHRVQQILTLVEKLLEERDQLVTNLEKAKTEFVEWLSECARLRNSLSHYERQSEEMGRSLGRFREERSALVGKERSIEESLKTAEARNAEHEARLRALQEEHAQDAHRTKTLNEKYAQASAKLDKTRGALQEMRSRARSLQELQDSLEGFDDAIKILRHHNRRGGVLEGVPFKVLAEVMDVPEGAEAAVAGFLGDQLQYLVVGELEEALDAISYINEQGLGRVGFIALNPPSSSGALDKGHIDPQGIGASLLEGIHWESGYEALGAILLQGVEVVENVTQAAEAWRSNGNHPLVTARGDVLRPPGIFEVGDRKGPSAGYLSRKREINALHSKIGSLGQQEAASFAQKEKLGQEISYLNAGLEKKHLEIHQTEITLTETRKDLYQAQEALKAVTQRLEILAWETEQNSDELTRIQEEQKQSTDRLEAVESRIKMAEQQVESMENDVYERQQFLEKCHEDLTQAQVHSASIHERTESHQRELLRLVARIDELVEERDRKDQQKKEGAEKVCVLMADVNRLRETLKSFVLEHDQAQEKLQAFRRSLDEHRSRLHELETSCQRERKEQRDLAQELQGIMLQHQELVLRMEHLEEELTGRLEMTSQDIPKAAENIPQGHHEQEKQKLLALKASLGRLGDVNLTAAEQYEELKERYDFLTSQQEDLEASLRSLNKAIQKINRTSRRRFREAFEALDAQFSKVFPILFKGGAAHLLLTEATDVLEAGVEIVVRPPGKRPQRISLLSGGEKALSAVGLIFAMLMIKPTPFCLLDEVDAPLDDANIKSFNGMLKDLSKGSQFILVTHNKRTMEMADNLYGVTMETPGVSKLISVKFQ
jgi:chromosome segregation protein